MVRSLKMMKNCTPLLMIGSKISQINQIQSMNYTGIILYFLRKVGELEFKSVRVKMSSHVMIVIFKWTINLKTIEKWCKLEEGMFSLTNL